MIGLQDLILTQDIKITILAKELGISPSMIWHWIQNNKIPKKHLLMLSKRFNVEEEYLNKKVNDISTYEPKIKGFNKYVIDGDVTYVTLRQRGNKPVLLTKIDTVLLPKLIDLKLSWYPAWSSFTQSYYAVAIERIEGKGHTRILNNIIKGSVGLTDHINHDTLDNRDDNLRLITVKENATNRKSRNKNNKSGHRNVSKRDKWWLVQLQIEGVNTVLKKFPLVQLEEAGEYAKEMREKYYGEFAGKS